MRSSSTTASGYEPRESQYYYDDEDEEDLDYEEDDDSTDYRAAISDTDKITHASVLKGHGNDMLKDDHVSSAITCYTEAIKLLDTIEAFSEVYQDGRALVAILYSNRAAAYIKDNNYKDAFTDSESCLSIDSQNPKAQFRRATCLCRLGDVSAAKHALLSMSNKDDRSIIALQQEVDKLDVQLTQVRSALDSQDAATANSVLLVVEGQVASPRCLALQLLRARVMLCSNDLTRAQKLLSALYLQPQYKGNMEIALWRGVALYYNGQQDLALKHFTEVLRQDPDNGHARKYFKLVRLLETRKNDANTLFKKGDHAAAIDAYTACLALDPLNTAYNATVYGNRAAAHMGAGSLHLASADCTESLRLCPSVAKVLARRGRAWLGLGQFADAVRDLRRACELDAGGGWEEDVRKAEALEKRSRQTSLYSVLGVSVVASADEVKKAYRRLAIQWHPDKHQGSAVAKAEETFKRITEAYEVLGDADKRRKYDMGMELDEINSGEPERGHRGFSRGGGGGFGGFGGFNFGGGFQRWAGRGGF